MEYPARLYRKAFNIYDVAPWKGVSDDRVIAFRSTVNNENVYVNFMGRLGEHLAVGAYIGDRGIQSLYDMMAGIDDYGPSNESYILAGQECVQLSFESEDDAFEDQLDCAYKYAETFDESLTGYKDIPSFVDFRPGYQPFTLKDEARLMILEEAMDVVLMYGDLHRGNYRGLNSINYYGVRKAPYFVKQNGKWMESEVTLPGIDSMKFIPRILFENETMIARLRKLPKVGTMYAELRLGPLTEWDDEREAFFFGEMLYSAFEKPEHIFEPVVNSDPNEDKEIAWGKMLSKFVSKVLIQQAKLIPEKIICRGIRTKYLLSDLCETLDIELDEDEFAEIDVLDEYIESLEKLNQTDAEGYNPGIEAVISELLDRLEGMSKSELKQIDPSLQDFLKSVPEDGIRPELNKRLQRILKYL